MQQSRFCIMGHVRAETTNDGSITAMISSEEMALGDQAVIGRWENRVATRGPPQQAGQSRPGEASGLSPWVSTEVPVHRDWLRRHGVRGDRVARYSRGVYVFPPHALPGRARVRRQLRAASARRGAWERATRAGGRRQREQSGADGVRTEMAVQWA